VYWKQQSTPQAAVVVPAFVGGAVVRNRMKRVLRSKILTLFQGAVIEDHSIAIVVYVKQSNESAALLDLEKFWNMYEKRNS